ARAAYTEAQQNYVASELRLKLAQRHDRIAQAKARLDQASAEARQMEDRIEKYTIRAPFDGFVVEEHTEVGAWIREGDPVAVVVQLDPVEVRAFVSEKFIGNLQIGARAVIRPNVPLAPGEAEPVGHVTGVVAEAVARSRTFPVKIHVENSNFRLKAGMLAEVELEVGDRAPALMVPKDALNLDGATPRIFVADPDPEDPKKATARMIAVEKGASLGRWIAVKPLDGELQAGALVVEKGNERLRPGAPLIPKSDGATPPPVDDQP
ncbi:MAG: efflux RND transporter periplasmic adaptor subunit, partial [Planctomycetales bacterium]|nr:efflux RND transporter periplasmic adaptor subunit [Planctomycetales bacterium]